MTTLQKLTIQGIRSFSPEQPEALEFETPVTLILGKNGCGKTTTIESLKAVTAGILPPNTDRGHSFIHDPEMVHMPDVNAQIRLAFRRVRAEDEKVILVQRTYQLSANKDDSTKKPTFKALDGSISTMDAATGEKYQAVSKKCVEMDTVVPSLLGVERAVLDSVVFCHQEESNWPLTEKTTLKKKFDEIFGSAKYTKALENIANTRKDLTKQLKERLHSFELLEKDLTASRTLRAEVTTLKDKQLVLGEALSEKLEQLSQVTNKLTELEKIQKHNEHKAHAIIQKTTLLNKISTDAKHLEAAIEELFTEALDVLHQQLHGISAVQIPAVAEQIVNTHKAVESASSSLVTAKQQVHTLKASLGEAANARDLIALKQGERSRKLAEISGVPTAAEMQQNAVEARENLRILDSEFAEEISGLEDTAKFHSVEAEKLSLKLASLSEKRTALAGDVVQAETASVRIAELTSRVAELQHELQEHSFAQSLRADEAASLASRKGEVHAELLLVAQQAGTVDVGAISEEISDLLSRMRPVVGECEPSEVAERVSNAVARLRAELAEVRGNRENLFADGLRLQFSLEMLHAEMTAKSENRVEKFENALREFSMAKSAELIYGRLQQRSVEKHKCQLCKKALASEQEISDFTSSVAEHTRQLPRLLEDLGAKLSQAKTQLGLFSDSGLSVADLTSRISEQERELASLNAHVEQSRMDEQRLDAELVAVNALLPECQRLRQLLDQVALSGEQPGAQRMADLKTQLAEIQRIEAAVSDSRMALQTEVAGTQSGISRMQSEIESLKAVRDRVSELKQALHQLEVSDAAMQRELQLNGEKLREVQVQLAATSTRKTSSLALAREHLAAAEKDASARTRMDEAVTEIDSVISMLESRISAIVHIHEALKTAEANEARFAVELETQRKSLGELQTRSTDLARVRGLLERNVQLKKMQAEISGLEAELASAGGQGEDLSGEIQKLRQHVLVCREAKARGEGELNQISEQTRQLEAKLVSPAYREIDIRVSQAWVGHETTATALRDLQRYHTALDRALMKYHQHKMQEINAAIAALWQSVYKGNDIDCIAIRSDVEEEGEGTGKRSYNYRVVMLNKDVELEMRGRCSAGQKVLASIIIRLALAESFCHNCGILALDEPTTNLDKANIQGLAEALCKLIESRRHSNNFQLIIITHDEDFVRSLSKLQVCDTCFRITKDSRGFSRINQELINELQ